MLFENIFLIIINYFLIDSKPESEQRDDIDETNSETDDQSYEESDSYASLTAVIIIVKLHKYKPFQLLLPNCF